MNDKYLELNDERLNEVKICWSRRDGELYFEYWMRMYWLRKYKLGCHCYDETFHSKQQFASRRGVKISTINLKKNMHENNWV